jgi:hypothetical protein
MNQEQLDAFVEVLLPMLEERVKE